MNESPDIEPPRRAWECPSCKLRWRTEGADKPTECPVCGRLAGEKHSTFMRRAMCRHGGIKAVRDAMVENMRKNQAEDGMQDPLITA